MSTLDQESTTIGGANCAVCQSPLRPDEEQTTCPSCHTQYHAGCWQDNQGCAVYGCSEVPPTEARDALEIPAAYWGREDKPCPACGRTILAAAVRCRHCGATFESARPETSREFLSRKGQKLRLGGLHQKLIWLFIFCVIPCTAPPAAFFGGIWYLSHRSDIKALPGVYPGLGLLSIVLAFGQTVLIALFAFLFAASQS